MSSTLANPTPSTADALTAPPMPAGVDSSSVRKRQP